MKLTVINWISEWLKQLLGKTIEIIFRIILFLLPLGVYLTILQSRSKVSSVSNLTIYTKDESVWQHVFPGFILVSINPNQFKEIVTEKKTSFKTWIKENQYILSFLFLLIIVVLMIYFGRGI